MGKKRKKFLFCLTGEVTFYNGTIDYLKAGKKL
jgi:hypothetical protein